MSGNALFSKPALLFALFVFSVVFFTQNLFALNDVATVATVDAEELEKLPINSHDVNVIGSRLPNFKVPFADIPANISYIPANSSAKNQDQIGEVKPHTFQESIKDIEGAVFYDEVGNGIDTTFSLRGFNTSSSVIFLVDGVRVNEVDGDVVSFPLLDMTDVESIQIERGSTSTIYGSNAFAGVIHITTGKPSKKPISLFGGFDYSSFNGYQFYQGLSGTLQDKVTGLAGKVGYYFKGGRNLSDGFRSNSEYRLTNFTAKVFYELPDEQGRIFFSWKNIDGAISNPGALTFDDFQTNPDQIDKPLDGRDRKNTIIQLGIEKKFLDDHLMASLLASQRYNDTRFTTTYATFASAGEPSPDTDLVTQKSRSTDLIWQIAYQDEWNDFRSLAVLGMEMRNADESTLNQDAFGEASVNAERFSEPRSAGLFWRETLNYDDVVIAHIGMRHDWHSVRINDAITATNNVSDRWRQSTISTGITVRPIKPMDVFFNYSQGFRVPTLSEMISPSAFGTSVATDLAPIKSDSYEVGSRLRFNDKAQLKASFFVIDLKNEIIFDSNSTTMLAPFGQNINAGKSRRTGIETRLDIQPVKEIKLYGSYTWTKAYIRETNSAQPTTGIPSVVDGRSLGLIPEHRMTWGAIARPLYQFGEYFENLELGLHGIFTGKQHPGNFESAPEATFASTGEAGYFIKSYIIWDFILSYAWKGQEIFFKINNLFDNKHFTHSVNATSFGGGISPPGIFNYVTPGAPREYIVGTRWEF